MRDIFEPFPPMETDNDVEEDEALHSASANGEDSGPQSVKITHKNITGSVSGVEKLSDLLDEALLQTPSSNAHGSVYISGRPAKAHMLTRM